MQGQDLISGNLTAPTVYALEHPQYGAELEGLIQNEFDGGASFPRALELVHLGGGIQAARRLARQEADMVRFSPAIRRLQTWRSEKPADIGGSALGFLGHWKAMQACLPHPACGAPF